MRRTSHAEGEVHDLKLDSAGRLAVDLKCASCGYNLQGANPAGTCSECGHPVAMSVNVSELAYANPDWLGKLARGSGWVMLSYLLYVPTILIAYTIVEAANTAERDAYAVAILCIAPILTAFGMWQMTTRDARLGSGDSEPSRQVIRILSICSIACPLLSVVIEIFFRQYTRLMDFIWLGMRWPSLVMFLVSYFLLFGYLTKHANSMRERNIAIQCRLISLGGIVTTLVGGCLLAMELYYYRYGLRTGPPNMMGCSFLLAAPITLLWSMGLIMLYHNELSLAEEHARTLHARMSNPPSSPACTHREKM